MKDAEQLRNEYNKRFSSDKNLWGSENIRHCLSIAKKVSVYSKQNQKKGLTLLDVGCATGFFTKAFSKLGYNAYGLDYSEVAIVKASNYHPECHFLHGDGFNPTIKNTFDLIFCKGFSGANTHDLEFVASWANKYIKILNHNGVFVFSYSSNFTGKEKAEETVNWAKDEIESFIKLINAKCIGVKIFYQYGIVSRLLEAFQMIIRRKRIKRYFYIFLKKE